MIGYIYKITNTINGKVYIGLTTRTVKQRFLEHIADTEKNTEKNSKIHSAMRKYGIDNFTLETIDTADTLEELGSKEIYWIQFYDSVNTGYNITKGGLGVRIDGHPQTFFEHTKESAKAIADQHLGSKLLTNGIEQKWVYKDELAQYLADGWWRGFCKPRNRDYSKMKSEGNPMHNNPRLRNTVWVYKVLEDNSIEKHQIQQIDLEIYEQEGFSKGMKPPKFKKSN